MRARLGSPGRWGGVPLPEHQDKQWPPLTALHGGYYLKSGYDAAVRYVKSWAMYGRRPRCKRNLTFCEAFGCSHVSGL
jgi:hypothetical protein